MFGVRNASLLSGHPHSLSICLEYSTFCSTDISPQLSSIPTITLVPMSFGYGVGDFIAVGTLAWNVYKSCKEAPESFGNISSEVLSLRAVLKEAEETVFAQPLSPTKQERLKAVGDGCYRVLKDLDDLCQKYQSLGTRSKLRIRDRMRWGSEDIPELRARLTLNTGLLTAWIRYVHLRVLSGSHTDGKFRSASQANVEKKLDRFLQEFEEGKRQGSVISSQTMDSLCMNDKHAWYTIQKELEDIGIPVAASDANKDLVFHWFTKAIANRAFEERPFDDSPTAVRNPRHRSCPPHPDTSREVKPHTGLGSTWTSLGGFFSAATNLASVVRAPECLDLFVCGNDGRVYNSWWKNGHGWNGWRSLGGSFTPGARVSAIARKQDQIDLFICGSDGCVYTSWWWKSRWNGWRSLGGSFTPGARVSAITRKQNQIDLFICGNDGCVYTSGWSEGVGWSGAKDDWKSLGGFFSAATNLTSIARAPECLDLFVCGNDGRVYNSWWKNGHGWNGWRSLGGSFTPGARVSAIARKQDQIDLFICGNDGCVYTSWWSEGVGWSGAKDDWKSLGGFFSAAANLTSVARAPKCLDLFICGNDGCVYTALREC